MGVEIDVACPDRTFMGYLSMPEHKIGPGIVLLHDEFGIDAIMRARADKLSQELGMFVLIPDLFWRIEPCLYLNASSQSDIRKASSLLSAFDSAAAMEDVLATIIALREIGGCTGRVGVLGYDIGGYLSYLAAARSDLNAAVSFYGPGIENNLDEAIKITNPLLIHMASKHNGDDINASLKEYMMISIHDYPDCKPGFARPGNPAFDRQNAELAEKRSNEFLAANLAF